VDFERALTVDMAEGSVIAIDNDADVDLTIKRRCPHDPGRRWRRRGHRDHQLHRRRHRRRGAEISRTGGLATLTCAAVYGGFFGAALGIILTAVLALAEPDDIRKVKVLKNMLATAVSLAAITIFIIQDAVKWQETSIMLAGALPGGYAGGMLVRVLPAHIVRWCVIAAGMVMSLIYAQRYWC